MGLVLQVIKSKIIDSAPSNNLQENKAKLQIKAQYTLSDGVSSIKAMVSEPEFNKLSNVPHNFNVIKVENFQKVMVKDQMILMLKAPLTIVHDHLEDKLGEPNDIGKVIQNKDAFDLNKEITVPAKAAAEPVVETP